MSRYIVQRLLQGIPLLFIISIILFVLMMNMGDPVATMGGRSVTRSSDRERLTRQLGLDQPIYMQYLFWLIGNDWTMLDLDGDGVPETPGTRKGVLRGDFGTSLVQRGKAVTEIIAERLPNTLLLMCASELIIVFGAILVGIYSALRQYSKLDHLITALSLLLALYQPVAGDLRFVTAVLKINNDLERMGDLGRHIAERALVLSRHREVRLPVDLRHMAAATQKMVRSSLDALVNQDADLAERVIAGDAEVDAYHQEMVPFVANQMRTHPDTIEILFHVLSASRHLERIADYPTNLAEDVVYLVRGEIIRHRQS